MLPKLVKNSNLKLIPIQFAFPSLRHPMGGAAERTTSSTSAVARPRRGVPRQDATGGAYLTTHTAIETSLAHTHKLTHTYAALYVYIYIACRYLIRCQCVCSTHN